MVRLNALVDDPLLLLNIRWGGGISLRPLILDTPSTLHLTAQQIPSAFPRIQYRTSEFLNTLVANPLTLLDTSQIHRLYLVGSEGHIIHSDGCPVGFEVYLEAAKRWVTNSQSLAGSEGQWRSQGMCKRALHYLSAPNCTTSNFRDLHYHA